jgi:hypothetical protein
LLGRSNGWYRRGRLMELELEAGKLTGRLMGISVLRRQGKEHESWNARY